jgi:hypothetical protein
MMGDMVSLVAERTARERAFNELSRDSRREILRHCQCLRAAIAQRQSTVGDEEVAALAQGEQALIRLVGLLIA